MKKIRQLVLLALILPSLFFAGWKFSNPQFVIAQDCEAEIENCDDYLDHESDPDQIKFQQCREDNSEKVQQKIDCLKGKLDYTRGQSQTLANAISIINGEISLQQLQISQTQGEIFQLEKEIGQLGERIEGLSLSLDRLTAMLLERVQASYRQKRTNPLLLLLSSASFKDFINQYKYLSLAEEQTALAMQQAENQRTLYDEQKSLKEIKQEELEDKRATLQNQQAGLLEKKQSKQIILNETKNDEATYQRLLEEAQREVDALKGFAFAQVGDSTCLGSAQPQPDGWYWNQRDARWCNQYIGNSKETMGAVGCLITSTAMIWTKHGHKISPSTIAANTNYFLKNYFQLEVSYTAYMKNPLPAPPGYTYGRYDYYSSKLIDQELDAGRPVIAHLAMGRDGHFIVIKGGRDGDYVINDPLFKSDMKLSEKYSTGMIDSIRTFRPS